MTKPNEVLTSIEMRFWDYAIPLLSSRSDTVKKIVKAGYFTMQRYHPKNDFFKTLLWACIGLSFGLAIGVIIY